MDSFGFLKADVRVVIQALDILCAKLACRPEGCAKAKCL